jgi:hypothetical protein
MPSKEDTVRIKKKPNISGKIQKLKENLLLTKGNETKADIINRTQAGRDYKGNTFAPYTKGYAKVRQDKGLGTKPNLTVTSQMLNGITVQTLKNGFKLYFNAKEQNDKAAGNNRKRPFFKLSKKDNEAIVEFLRKKIRQILNTK